MNFFALEIKRTIKRNKKYSSWKEFGDDDANSMNFIHSKSAQRSFHFIDTLYNLLNQCYSPISAAACNRSASNSGSWQAIASRSSWSLTASRSAGTASLSWSATAPSLPTDARYISTARCGNDDSGNLDVWTCRQKETQVIYT